MRMRGEVGGWWLTLFVILQSMWSPDSNLQLRDKYQLDRTTADHIQSVPQWSCCAVWGICLFLCMWNVRKVKKSKVCIKVSRSLPQETCHAPPETPGFESSRYFRSYEHIFLYFIKYLHSSQPADIKLLLLWRRYFRSHYLTSRSCPALPLIGCK